MEIRYFQIIIPIVSCLFILFQYQEYGRKKTGLKDLMITSAFWVGVACIAIFPDFFSNTIAKAFGIEDNINALIFFALGILLYFQLQIYKKVRHQDVVITELTRKIAIDNAKHKQN